MSDEIAPKMFVTGVGYLTITTIGGRVKIPNSEGAWVICDGGNQFVPFSGEMKSIVSPKMASHTLAFICLPRLITQKELSLVRKILDEKNGQKIIMNS